MDDDPLRFRLSHDHWRESEKIRSRTAAEDYDYNKRAECCPVAVAARKAGIKTALVDDASRWVGGSGVFDEARYHDLVDEAAVVLGVEADHGTSLYRLDDRADKAVAEFDWCRSWPFDTEEVMVELEGI